MEKAAPRAVSKHAKLSALFAITAYVALALPDPWGLVVTKLPVVLPLAAIALYQSRSAFRELDADPTRRGKALAWVGLAMGILLFVVPVVALLGIAYDAVTGRR